MLCDVPTDGKLRWPSALGLSTIPSAKQPPCFLHRILGLPFPSLNPALCVHRATRADRPTVFLPTSHLNPSPASTWVPRGAVLPGLPLSILASRCDINPPLLLQLQHMAISRGVSACRRPFLELLTHVSKTRNTVTPYPSSHPDLLPRRLSGAL